MKHFLTLILFSIILISCGKESLDFDYDPGRMHYDGPNLTAPFLPAGTAEAAAKFTPKILDLYDGHEITAVMLSIYDIPDQCRLIIYGDGNGSEPGDILYETDLKPLIEPGKWNTVQLTEPVQIPESGDLWIAIRSVHSTALQVIGCDAGPSKDNGDWLYESSDQDWRSFLDRGGDDINWNIRAVID